MRLRMRLLAMACMCRAPYGLTAASLMLNRISIYARIMDNCLMRLWIERAGARDVVGACGLVDEDDCLLFLLGLT